MDICRREKQIGKVTEKVIFCLDKLEKEGFTKNVDWDTQITRRLTLEELIGALVHAEQEIDQQEKEIVIKKCFLKNLYSLKLTHLIKVEGVKL